MKTIFVFDLKIGEYCEAIQLGVFSREVKSSQRGDSFLTLTLVDRTGAIDAVWFDCQSPALIREGDVIEVGGQVRERNGKPQIKITYGARINEYEISDFQRRTPYDIGQLEDALHQYVDKVTDPHIKSLLKSIVEDDETRDRLIDSPAGMKVHHCYVGGLLEHIVSMTRTAWALCNQHKRLNRDVLIAGCILHDIGKIYELKVGITFGYTVEGSLIGHVPIAYSMIDRFSDRIDGFPHETKRLIQHLVLSHHGELDKGAVKLPMTPEAIALSVIDSLDARLEQAFRLIEEAPAEDEFTNYIPSMERRLYVRTNETTQVAIP